MLSSVRTVLGAGCRCCLVLTAGVWTGGWWLGDVALLPDRGASWYCWKLLEPTFWTRASEWAGYAAHQLVTWRLILYAQRHVRDRPAGCIR